MTTETEVKTEAKPVDETAGFTIANSDMDKIVAAQEENTNEGNVTSSGDDTGETSDNTGSEGANGTDTAATEAKAPKKAKGAQKRINDLVRDRENTKRENEALKRENEALKSKTESKDTQTKEPVESDFDNYSDYLDAVDEFDQASVKANSEKKSEDVKADKAETSKADKDQSTSPDTITAIAVLQEAVKSAENLPEDFDKVTTSQDLMITGDMVEAMSECDNATDVLYHLGKNPDLAQEIAGKTAKQQERAIARLDIGQPWKSKAKPPTKTSNAADPISPVRGSAAQEKSLSQKAKNFSEYEAQRKADIAKDSGSTW